MTPPSNIIELCETIQRKIAQHPYPISNYAANTLPMLELKAIAEALLIAVEALEEMVQGKPQHLDNGITVSFTMTDNEVQQRASQALSRIKSIPLS